MLNHIVVMGRLTQDPELRHAGETPVCSFRIACDRDFADKSGNRETDFFDVVAWRGLGENVAKYFAKGRMAVVSGRLQIRPWKDKEGGNRTSTEIVAEHVYFGDSKKAENGHGGNNQGNNYTPPDNFVPDFNELDDGDLPM
ncbi:single-stranded DNA-binding protein [Ruminococcus sp.]|uniref:single-stranded DNA-binding protein n=1 Tax=Ruminococcus sp. TaxID=41978 RepID=UPI0025F0F0E5|nr:single-stranded DNA-binding protein [Ruminococcus sp.]MBR1430146.1 single-stranded DNA-binding protein [Ruminococcus sp.]